MSDGTIGITPPEPRDDVPKPMPYYFAKLRREREAHYAGWPRRHNRAAVLTMVHNERLFLPIWLRYYSRFFGPDDIYVLDHDTTDGSTSGEGFVRIPVSHETIDHTWMVSEIQAKQHELLATYDVVLLADVDEIVTPGPGCGTLGDYVERFDEEFVNCLGHDVVHMIDREPPLDPERPILDQRGYWFVNYGYSKPLLSMAPTVWKPGFHGRDDDRFRLDPDLLLIHLHRVDFELCRARHRYRSERRWNEHDLEENWAQHNRIVGGEDFASWFYGDTGFPTVEVVIQPIPAELRGLF